MALERICCTPDDHILILDGGENGVGCGTINQDGHLYWIDQTEAYRLPDRYKDTPFFLYPPCGGYQEGLIMVSLLGEIELQYHHPFAAAAGMWGWIDLDGVEVIPPQYVFAMSFFGGQAIVCKGEWSIDDQQRYWCNEERWGVINRNGDEIVPCRFDAVYEIAHTDRFVLCHKGGWQNGCSCIFDIERSCELLDLHFDFDAGYLFNSCCFENDCICFQSHMPGQGTDVQYVYSLAENRWIVDHQIQHHAIRHTVQVDGEDIIVY